MDPTHLHVTLVNEDKEVRFYDDLEPIEEGLTLGEIYRQAMREYGRPSGPVYVDQQNGPPKKVGWTFKKKMQYTDKGTYLRTAWVCPVHVEERKIHAVTIGK